MRVVVLTEQRFLRGPDGRVWVNHTFTRRFWQNYLLAFDRVRVVARVLAVEKVPAGYSHADGDGIEFHDVPSYQGPAAFLQSYVSVRAAVLSGVEDDDAVILRLGSQLANILFPKLLRDGHPYAVEVVGDPWDVFAPGVIDHPLRPLFRCWFYWNLRLQCLHAHAAAYVTKYTLQKRYPVQGAAPTTNYSSVDLGFARPLRASVSTSDVVIEDALLAEPPRETPGSGPWQLVLVGSLEQPYKGVDVAIRALSQILSEGLAVRLVVIGDGQLRKKLQAQAQALGVAHAVTFRGSLPRLEVLHELRRSDIFLIPSRTEGLPRALVEAMALGVPAVGSRIGGIPELLEPEEMVPLGESRPLAKLISAVLGDPTRRTKMSERNRTKALEFRESVLRDQRTAYYHHVRRLTEEWGHSRA
jgi:glycosyltransferase involved in cell wall biosynthesis